MHPRLGEKASTPYTERSQFAPKITPFFVVHTRELGKTESVPHSRQPQEKRSRAIDCSCRSRVESGKGKGSVGAKGEGHTHQAWAGRARSPPSLPCGPPLHLVLTAQLHTAGQGMLLSNVVTHQLGSEKKAGLPLGPPTPVAPTVFGSSFRREHPGLCGWKLSLTVRSDRSSPHLFSNRPLLRNLLPTRSVRTHLNSSQERGWQVHQREVGRTPHAGTGRAWVALILRLANGKDSLYISTCAQAPLFGNEPTVSGCWRWKTVISRLW